MMKEFLSSSTLFGGNAPFIEEQYEAWLADPAAVTPEWRRYFDDLADGQADVPHAPVIDSFIRLAKNRKLAPAMVDVAATDKQVRVLQLINRYRTLGMFRADLDPLKRLDPPYIADLDPSTYGFSSADYEAEWSVGSFRGGPQRMKLKDLVVALETTYCGTIGAEYMYIHDTEQRRFCQERLETIHARPSYDPDAKRHILERLTAAETL